MQHPLFPVAVVMRRVALENRWVSHKWDLAEVRPDELRGVVTREEIGRETWLWRGFTLDLHPSEAQGYYLNLSAPDPRVFVMWRLDQWDGEETARPWLTTASYDEAARLMEGGETVDSAQMPEEVHAWMAPWVATNYTPEPRRKHKRNQAFWQDEPGGAEAGGGGAGARDKR
jgi:hypothetical protein